MLITTWGILDTLDPMLGQPLLILDPSLANITLIPSTQTMLPLQVNSHIVLVPGYVSTKCTGILPIVLSYSIMLNNV